MRVSVSGTAGASAGQGTTVTPRPNAASTDGAYGAAVTRAKWITGGMFVVLVLLHQKGSS